MDYNATLPAASGLAQG